MQPAPNAGKRVCYTLAGKIPALIGYKRLREIRVNQSHAELHQTHLNICKLRLLLLTEWKTALRGVKKIL